jgi:hypothetical protein
VAAGHIGRHLLIVRGRSRQPGCQDNQDRFLHHPLFTEF